MENWQWIIDIFTFIGMAVCIIIALIAIVWITCFAVKLLIKTFGVKVGKSYEIMIEDISKKAETKKEIKEIKRNAAAQKKKELLDMKLNAKQRIHEMKKQKLAEKLAQKEELAKAKIFAEEKPVVENVDAEPEVEEIAAEEEVEETPKKAKTSKKSNK